MLCVTSHKVRLFSPVSLVLLAALVIASLVSGTDPVYGQQVGVAKTPNMVGEWRGQAQLVYFDNVDDPVGQPHFVQTAIDEFVLNIGTQTGRAFASLGPDGGKLTGVILPDGTLSIQMFGGNDRWFLTGTLALQHGRYVIVGYVHSFEDLTRASTPSMATGYFQLTKSQ